MAFQAEYTSLAHMAQKLSLYEQRHPDLYQDKFKRPVILVETEEDEDSAGNQEVAVAEWARGANLVSCKWVKPQWPVKGFDFDVSKAEQIFNLLLKEKQLRLPKGHKIPTVQELNGRPYCKWHNSFTHTTSDCKVLRQQIQMAIEQGRPVYHPGKDKEESSHPRGKEKEEAGPRDRPRYDDKRYVTEEQVRNVRYQRTLSEHLLNKYESQYDLRRRYDEDDEKYHRFDRDNEDSVMMETTKDMNAAPRRRQDGRRTWTDTGIVLSSSIAGIQE
ncbi:hypothetical protein QYE76_046165 [Lolium multiflorum]|uniref:Uncharacterized protein n=1 Tax=Lolium multiflorum TaxID=4521 RepID=A0AAD8TP82_LOLMU|nr:hypothetical protein QYE76_046165 [Lolium multiflorum]